jgi:hypothetical protein
MGTLTEANKENGDSVLPANDAKTRECFARQPLRLPDSLFLIFVAFCKKTGACLCFCCSHPFHPCNLSRRSRPARADPRFILSLCHSPHLYAGVIKPSGPAKIALMNARRRASMKQIIGLLCSASFCVGAAWVEYQIMLHLGSVVILFAVASVLAALSGALFRAPEGYERADGFFGRVTGGPMLSATSESSTGTCSENFAKP